MRVLLLLSLVLVIPIVVSESLVSKTELKTTTLAEWPEKLKAYQPNIVVLDLWATWCISCLERFPHMVEMHNQYKDKGVIFVSLLLEDPEEPQAIEMARKFLDKQQADFDHYFMNENLMHSFEQLDLLGIPAVFIYASDGSLAYRLTNDNPNKQFTEGDVQTAIQTLLTKDK
ncbi:TlpA disulfide reductase family protein [Marinicella sp. W31]|uniref:TlpA disulfide reductase family protein n=1 Tax=Marinicella sp. W31 TaxID=3023713 RepID=UPI0037577A54